MPLSPRFLRRSPAPRLLLATLFSAVFLLPTTPAPAQAPGDQTEQAEQAPPPTAPTVPAAQRTPQAVLKAFFTRMQEDRKKEAADLLDLSELAAIAAESRAPDLVYKLYRLIPALGFPPTAGGGGPIDFSSVVDNPDHPEPWRLSEWLEAPEEAAASIVIARGEDKAWRFDATTVQQIDSLYEAVEERIERQSPLPDVVGESTAPQEPSESFSLSIRRLFPLALRTTHFVLPTYQWLLLALWLPLGRLVDLATRRLLTLVGDRVLRRIDPEFVDHRGTTERVWRPVGRLAMAASWVALAFVIGMSYDVTNVLLTVLTIVAIIAAVLAIFRVLDLVAECLIRRAKRNTRRFDDLFLPLAATTAKFATVLLGIGAAIAAFDFELPTALLGGLGIGGVAIALASQETLSNFIGSITLLFDRPFEVGDWVCVDGMEGEVESLGFRSTKLRTGPNSQVSVPNSKLAAANVDNLGRRRYRRYLSKLGVEYGTPTDKIEAFCEGIRELIRRQPHTRKDFYAAYFNDFGASSLDVIVVAYFEVPDWVTELRERERLLLDIARLAESLGVAFAFPTQTLHLHRGEAGAIPDQPLSEEPTLAGARSAAEIAGELPNYQDRPGRVKFPGPTQLPDTNA